jgi:acetylornithine/LysW-gamma-L-lysine aminotransferase
MQAIPVIQGSIRSGQIVKFQPDTFGLSHHVSGLRSDTFPELVACHPFKENQASHPVPLLLQVKLPGYRRGPCCDGFQNHRYSTSLTKYLLGRIDKRGHRSLVAPEGLDRAFLCNSGTEAVEAAIKFARVSTGRPGIVAARGGFHGRTLGSLSATWKSDYRQPFAPLVPCFSHVPFNDIGALEAAVTDETAAVILEPVQGEGGVHPARGEYLRAASELCRDRGALLILDEVQTGFGRTGKLFACEHFGVTPDLLAVAKSMAGGLPIGACLIGPAVGRLPAMSHGSTFGGNPLAAAAALAAITVMTSPYPAPTSAYTLVQHAARSGRLLMEGLRAIRSPLIREVRGLGLLVGIELKVKVTPVLQRLQAPATGEPRVLALPAGLTVLRLLPPLITGDDDLQRVVDAVETAIHE